MSTAAEYLKVYKELEITCYALFVPTLALWNGLLARTLISKDRQKLVPLIVISVLMILSLVATIILWQLEYTYNDRKYNGNLNHLYLARQILQACAFIANTTFNLAHWVFAFSYWALSYRLELISKNVPEDIHNRRLNTVNVIVCLINVAIPAINWVFIMKKEYKAATITYDIEQLSLVASCIVLVWAICRLVRLAKSLSEKMANKVMIIMHIVAYLSIIISNANSYVTFSKSTLRAYEISTICNLAVYSVCTVIFGVIVN
jgi:hypothetical protein